ncbi:MAG: hypothetical protein J4431_03680 [Candidatus Aenigmarchaeota archaeon]|nr:hypothetical protein [Candidatus Aenigmarchaeota archaeon]
MDSMVKLFIERAKNELKIDEVLLRLSEDNSTKKTFAVKENMTFYSGTITHAYYCIFYSAKAILATKNIKTGAPEIHKKPFDSFKKHFVDTGIIDAELLKIYRSMIIRADDLLEIFSIERPNGETSPIIPYTAGK